MNKTTNEKIYFLIKCVIVVEKNYEFMSYNSSFLFFYLNLGTHVKIRYVNTMFNLNKLSYELYFINISLQIH